VARTFGSIGPGLGWGSRITAGLTALPVRAVYSAAGFCTPQSSYARTRAAALAERIASGATVYLAGIGVSGHNSGVALVEVNRSTGVRLLCNNEEERYTGIKHYSGFPHLSLVAMLEELRDRGLAGSDVDAWLGTWSYPDYLVSGTRAMMEHAPRSLAFLMPSTNRAFNYTQALKALPAPARLGRALGRRGRVPIIAMRHHDNHAYMAYLSSPFSADDEPVIVTVLDGYGDDAAISYYRADSNGLQRIYANRSLLDSVGLLYGMLSSTQGGWTPLSSEGRYMGAAAWGNSDRLTNPYYRQLRQLVYFGAQGEIRLNRAMTAMHLYGERAPYNAALREILGEPVEADRMWQPDAVLRVEDIHHSPLTEERVDKAAAVQLLFEDVLFHIVQHLICLTGSHRLVMAGGTALNCVATMRLLDRFDESFYLRYRKMQKRLHVWVPPTPSDQGVTIGAAYNFAAQLGVGSAIPINHAFFCGRPPSITEVERALATVPEIGHVDLSDLDRAQLADLLAFLVSNGGIVGLCQGRAETGPRALGHRSILADPRRHDALSRINALVKYREAVRPLAPMATLEAAQRFFELSPGASDDDYNAYNYMVLTARARPESYALIPAVIHRDGTSRVQIVREETDPFTHAFLRAMGRRAGVEVSVNTSFNVGSPIAQTTEQVLNTLHRAKGLTGAFLLTEDGGAFLVWHDVTQAPKDRGRLLHSLVRAWQREVGQSLKSMPTAEFNYA
jgi:carbamoyltransferase